MHEALNRNLYLVKEHVGMFKAANNFDVYDPDTGEILLECREDHLGFLTKMLRFTDYKRMTPFDVQLRTSDGAQVLQVQRGVYEDSIGLVRDRLDFLSESDQQQVLRTTAERGFFFR